MGAWSVVSATGGHVPLDTLTNLGTDFKAVFRLKYTTSMFGSFVDTPKLAWDEVIYYNDYVKRSCWSFKGNMYTHKPSSPTMAVWAQRYFRAYRAACGLNVADGLYASQMKGYSKLFTLAGVALTGPAATAALGAHVGFANQNKAVRDYLKSKGGILEIEVHDIPSLLKPKADGTLKNVERVLIFDCGVTGMGPRVKCWQHLKMDSTQLPGAWTNNFQMGGNPPGVKVTGLANDPTGPIAADPNLPAGGIL